MLKIFNLKPNMRQLLPQFHVLKNINPYVCLWEFKELFATFQDQNCSIEIISVKNVSFPLKDKGLTLMSPHFIRTWQEMQVAFLERHFPLLRRTTIQKKMMNFVPKDERDFINFGKGVKNWFMHAHIMDLRLCNW